MKRMRVRKIHDELGDVLDIFHSDFAKETGYYDRGSKSASQKALAKVLKDEVLPNIKVVKLNKRRRKTVGMRIKL